MSGQDGYDAASVAGQIAGGGEQLPPVTPEQLIERFCTDLKPTRDDERGGGLTVARGHCGYMGGRGDSMVVGFDDGYDFMGYLSDRGWSPLPAKGDWPYVVYLAYKAREPYAIAEYCEADLTVWTFDDGEAAQAFYRTIKDAP